MKLCWTTGVLVVWLATAALAENISVTAKPAATEVAPGQSFLVEVTARGPSDTEWNFPHEVTSEHVDLALESPPQNTTGPIAKAMYRATVFALGEVPLPAITVHYRRSAGSPSSASSPPVPLTVVSALPKGEENPQPADLRPPVPVAIGTAFWVGVGLALALIAAAAAWLLPRRRRTAEPATAAVPQLPPEEEARLALERLAASGLIEREDFRQFYIELTTIAKRYLERRLGAPVLEMTSTEVLALLRDHPLAGPHLPAVRDLVWAADWVKFARGSAQAEAARRHLATVHTIVSSIEETLQAQARVSKEAA